MSFSVFADRHGNGGDVVVCYDDETHTNQISIELLDYYEARKLGEKIELGNAGNYLDRINFALDRLNQIDPKVADEFRTLVANVISQIQFIRGQELNDVSDSDEDFRGKFCEILQIAVYRPLARYGRKKYLVDEDLWDQLSENDKAGLILHEVIYSHVLRFGAENSIGARYFNGLISSERVRFIGPAKLGELKRDFHLYFFNLKGSTDLEWRNGVDLHAEWKIPAHGGMLKKQVIEVYDEETCNSFPLYIQELSAKEKNHKIILEKLKVKTKNKSELSFYFQMTSYDHVGLKAISVCSQAKLNDIDPPQPAERLRWWGPWGPNSDIQAGWSPSRSGDIAFQTIDLFSDASCGGAIISTDKLSATESSFEYEMPELEGNTFSFMIGTYDHANNSTRSTCSNAIVIDREAPEAATGLSFLQTSPSSGTSLTANWIISSDLDVEAQRIDFYLSESCSHSLNSSTTLDRTTSSYTLNGVTNNNTYSYIIKTFDSSGNSSSSACSSAILIDTSAPSPARGLKWLQGSSSNLSSIVATWTSSGQGERQLLKIYQDKACSSTPVEIKAIKGLVGAFKFSSAISQNSYTFSVETVDPAGNSSLSMCSRPILIDTHAPANATNLGWVETSPTSSSFARAIWTPSSDSGLTSQELQFYSDPLCSVPVGNLRQLGHLENSAILNAFGDEESYSYTVSSIDNAGNTSTSVCSSSILIDGVAPTIASSLTFDQDSFSNTTNLTTSWTPSNSTDIESQLVEYFTDACFTNLVSSQILAAGIASDSFTGAHGQRYYFRVTSLDFAGNASVSACSSRFVTVDTETPVSATNLDWIETSSSDLSSISAVWTLSSSSDILEQTVVFSENPSCSKILRSERIAPIHSQFELPTTIYGGKNLYFYIVTTDYAGNSSFSACSPHRTIHDIQSKLKVKITKSPSIIKANMNSYEIAGTCSHDGDIVTLSITNSIKENSVCRKSKWSFVLDVSQLQDSQNILITADHYDRAGNSAVQSAVSVKKETEPSYLATNVGGSTSTTIVAFENNTNVTLNGLVIKGSPLSQGQTIKLKTKQFDIVKSDKPVYIAGKRSSGNRVGSSSNANIVWSPETYSARSFSFSAIRGSSQILSLFATENSKVTVHFGGRTYAQVDLIAGRGRSIVLKSLGSYQIKSSGAILAYNFAEFGRGSSIVDARAILPGFKELIGFPSNSMELTSSSNFTQYTFIHSNSSLGGGKLKGSGSITISPEGRATSLYQSESLLVSANNEIGGMSVADSNGNSSSSFAPTNLMRKKFAINVDSDYVAFASKDAGFIDVYAPEQTIGVDRPIDRLILTRSGTNSGAPYKARRAATPRGYRFVSSVDLAGWYQPSTNAGAADQDETILYGFND